MKLNYNVFAHKTSFHDMLFFCVFCECLIQHCMSSGAFFFCHMLMFHVTLHIFVDIWRLMSVMEECCMTCRRTPDPLEELNWMYWISDRSISIIHREDMWGSSELFFHSVKKYRTASLCLTGCLPSLSGLLLIFSVSAVYYTPALCVCLSSARGALHPAMTMK